VLVAHGVLTPRQAERLAERDGRSLWSVAAAGARVVGATAAEPEAPRSTPRALIADDDPQMRRLIRGVLQRDGFEAVEASDGLEGLGVLEELRARRSAPPACR
jgi:hypothetical protein